MYYSWNCLCLNQYYCLLCIVSLNVNVAFKVHTVGSKSIWTLRLSQIKYIYIYIDILETYLDVFGH